MEGNSGSDRLMQPGLLVLSRIKFPCVQLFDLFPMPFTGIFNLFIYFCTTISYSVSSLSRHPGATTAMYLHFYLNCHSTQDLQQGIHTTSPCNLRAERTVPFQFTISFCFVSCKQFISAPKGLLFISACFQIETFSEPSLFQWA